MTSEPTYMFCVGATKAGTSWLYRYLAGHPDCHFRTIKELHYFNKTKAQQFQHAAEALGPEIARLENEPEVGATAVARRKVRKLQDLDEWKTVLDEGEVDLSAYRSFLTQGRGQKVLVGDVTPAYALLAADRLKMLCRVGPDVRLVFLMREPVARLWSHVRMVAMRRAPQAFATEAPALFQRIIANENTAEATGIKDRGDYRTILQKLRRIVDPANLLVMFYEDLMTTRGVARLADFLGIARWPGKFSDRAFGGVTLALPSDLHAAALTFLRPQYDFVARQYQPLPDAWMTAIEKGFA